LATLAYGDPARQRDYALAALLGAHIERLAAKTSNRRSTWSGPGGDVDESAAGGGRAFGVCEPRGLDTAGHGHIIGRVLVVIFAALFLLGGVLAGIGEVGGRDMFDWSGLGRGLLSITVMAVGVLFSWKRPGQAAPKQSALNGTSPGEES